MAGLACISATERDLRVRNWVDVSVGGEATCALRDDGTTQCWPESPAGWDCPNGGGNRSNITAIHSGWEHACAVDEGGDVDCWGRCIVFDDGVLPSVEGSFTWVEAGVRRTCAGDDDGAWTCWGPGVEWYGEGTPAATVDAFSVWHDACVVVDGTVDCWGEGGRDPTNLGALFVADVSMADSATCVVDDLGDVWCGDTFTSLGQTFDPIGSGMASFDTTLKDSGCGITLGGEIRCFGFGQTAFEIEPPADSWSTVSATADVACGITTAGSLWCWGSDTDPRFPR